MLVAVGGADLQVLCGFWELCGFLAPGKVCVIRLNLKLISTVDRGGLGRFYKIIDGNSARNQSKQAPSWVVDVGIRAYWPCDFWV